MTVYLAFYWVSDPNEVSLVMVQVIATEAGGSQFVKRDIQKERPDYVI